MTDGPSARRVGHGLAWSTGGMLVLRLGNVLVGILMARLIAPEQFGVFAVALTVWAVLSTLADFGLGADLVRARDLERRAPTVATLGLGISAMLAVAMVLAAEPLAAAFGSPDSAGVIRLMGVSIAVFGFSIVPAARLQRAFRQRAVFVVNGLGLLASAATMASLATAGAGPYALAWGQIAGQATVVVGLFVATRTRLRVGFDPAVAGESLAFCVPLAGANVLSWMLLSLDNLIVSRTLGPEQLGLYVLAFNVSSWSMSILGSALRVIALPAFAQLESTGQRNRALVGSVGPVVAVAAPLAVVLAASAVPLVHVLYGARWSASATALVGLAVFGGIRVLFDLVATFLVAVGTTRALLVVQVVWLLTMVPAMVVGVSVWGLRGAGWAHVAVALGVVLPAYLVCLHRVGVAVGPFLLACVFPVVAAVPAGLACWWIAGQDGAPLLLLAGAGAAAVLLYALPLAHWWLRAVRGLRRAAADPVTDHSPIGEPA